jgi:CMP-N-acetylneuraminic acid synthetase
MRILGIIPARGGSKRLPGKNMAFVGDNTLIGHAVTAAANSGVICRTVISTDSKEIRAKFAALAPFLRPKELATDEARIVDVALHALEFCEKWWKGEQGEKFDAVMILQPTSPLRRASHVRQAAEMLEAGENAVVSVKECPKNVVSADTLKKCSVGHYVLNGAIFALKVAYLHKYKSLQVPKARAFVMPEANSVDVDTMQDLERARELYPVVLEQERTNDKALAEMQP